jgi:predicted outer membrane repeat protein
MSRLSRIRPFQLDLLWLVSLVFALSPGSPVLAETYTVGSSLACDYSSLASAYNNITSGDILHVQGGVTYQAAAPLSNIEVHGGYTADCNGTRTASLTVIEVPAGQRHFSVGSGQLLVLSQLRLQGARLDAARRVVSGPTLGGAIYSSDGFVTLERVEIVDNWAGAGGGVYSSGGLTVKDSLFSDNRATDADDGDGGAIRCSGPASAWISGTSFYDNQATQDGGAVSATGCTVYLNDNGHSGFEMKRNQATEGGAVHGSQGSAIHLNSGAFRAVLADNSSDRSGGAVQVEGESELYVAGVRFEANTSLEGGAIYSDLSSVDVGYGLSTSCRESDGACVELIDNDATAGGAISSIESDVHLQSVLASGNSASLDGSFLLVYLPKQTSIGGSLVTDTPVEDPGSVVSYGGGVGSDYLYVRGSTFADNQSTDPVIDVQQGSSLRVEYSILWGNSGDPIDSSAAANVIDCNIVDDLAQLPPGHTDSAVLDPAFVGAGDYRLSKTSPAIDRCQRIDFGSDLASWTRPMGDAHDAGAYESEGLFRASFEDASTSRFSP